MLVGSGRALHAYSPVIRIRQSFFGPAAMPDSEFVIPRHSPRQTRNTAIIQKETFPLEAQCPTLYQNNPQPCVQKRKRENIKAAIQSSTCKRG
jgi:hypothetical protein